MAKITSNALDQVSSASCEFFINGVKAVMGSDAFGQPVSPTITNGDLLEIKSSIGEKVVSAKYFDGFSQPINFVANGDYVELNYNSSTGNIASLTIATEVASTPYTLSYKAIQTIYNSNAKLLINDVHRPVETDGFGQPVSAEIFEGDVLKIEPDEGFEVISAQYTDPFSQPRPFTIVDGVAILEFGITYQPNDIDNFTLIVEQPTPEIVSSNKIYLVDGDVISGVNGERFVTLPDDVTVDYGDYIINLIQIPTIIDPKYVLENQNIVLGNRPLTVSAPLISSDKIEIDLGTITFNSTENNSEDYLGYVFELFLPNSNPINIDPEYVVNVEISIKYVVDVYTGKAEILLSTTKTGEIFNISSVDLGLQIPYSKLTLSSANVENSNVSFGGFNGISTPYLQVSKNEAYNLDSQFKTIIEGSGTLTGKSGYFEVSKIDLVGKMSVNDKRDLMAILNEGVKIK